MSEKNAYVRDGLIPKKVANKVSTIAENNERLPAKGSFPLFAGGG